MERSGTLWLDADLALTGDLFSERALVLRRHMHRMGTLRLVCLDDDRDHPGHLWSSLLRDVLSEPAPHLTALRVSYTPVSTSRQ
ncbi:hypothetical protein AURDEDRAFT_115786 [Auricularia subglabra TFB-10046 SS5]|nr:hypothetical protein AURDEDRAFT_115786 [Auricularia subglabra TFB-10046 SS5]